MTIDPYVVLGVSRTATDEELTSAYRKLAKKYHPDMNSGSKAAEKKMQEINAAYDQIKNERSGGANGASGANGAYRSTGRSAYGGGPFNGGYRQTGRGYGGSNDPFGGFGGFGGYEDDGDSDDPFGEDAGYTGAQEPRIVQIEMCIRAGYYQQALNHLFAFDASERGAAWFYYSALANVGVGNRVTALRHAQEAVRLAPEVRAYQNLLYRLERSGYAYRQAGTSQGFDMRNIGRALLQCLFSQLLCYCFCCRPC